MRKTCKTERAAQIELGKLLEQAAVGCQPASAVTVAQLPDQYVSTAGWDVSTRKATSGTSAVGGGPRTGILHWNGTAWKRVPGPSATMAAAIP